VKTPVSLRDRLEALGSLEEGEAASSPARALATGQESERPRDGTRLVLAVLALAVVASLRAPDRYPSDVGARGGLWWTRSLAAAALALACGSGAEPRHLILISIDTLRADRLGTYAYERPTSPWLDALAARGVRFETVIAESSWTLPSHVALFSGLAPPLHGVETPTQRIPAPVRTLPNVLWIHGFETLGFTGGAYLDPRFGFDRGFEHYHPVGLTLSGALAAAQRKLAERDPDDRFFLFLHTYDVHCPYEPPPRYALAFRSEEAAPVETAGRCGNPHFNAMDLTPAQALHLSDRYDASIRHADDRLAAFAQWLAEEELLAETLLVVVSDHGEELLEHGRIGHEDTLYRESLHVPWILAGPGLAPRVVEEPAGLADVAPTLLDLLGVPEKLGRGRSLADRVRGGDTAGAAPAPRFSRNEWRIPLRSLVWGRWHLVSWPETGRSELYDWRSDPREMRDLWGRDPERDRELRERLVQRDLALAEAPPTPVERAPTPAEAERRLLGQLGYVE